MEKTRIIMIFAIIGALALFYHSGAAQTNEQISQELTKSEKSMAESIDKFGFSLFKEIVAEKPGSTVVISPLSVSLALAMTYNGADGETEKAMASTLQLPDLSTQEINDAYRGLNESLLNSDSDVKFSIANSIWHRLGFEVEPEFIDVNKMNFNSEIRPLNFALPEAVDTINSWVDSHTNGKIKTILDEPIPPEAMMYLINAIYFKGIWSDKFDPELTSDDWFYLPDSSRVKCKLMSKSGEFSYFENDKFQAVDLPYGNGAFTMTVILPLPATDIDNLVDDFSEGVWGNAEIPLSKKPGKLYLPKFKVEFGADLIRVLKSLGMGIAFNPMKADFTGISKKDSLYISKVVHKTFIEVDEKGTEAAAATLVGMRCTSAGPTGIEPFVMRVDRPFIFFIRERQSGTMLFMGKIAQLD